jgi:hypothetical protein
MQKLQRSGTVSASIVVACAAVACSDSPTQPEPTPADAETFAIVSMATGAAWATVPGSSLPVELPCPAGGTRRLDGRIESSEDGDGVRRIEVDLEARQNACAFVVQDTRIETTGESHLTGITRLRVSVQEQTLEVLQHEFHEVGEYTTTTDGRSITCAIDISHTFQPASNTMRLSGTACGHRIDVERPVLTP